MKRICSHLVAIFTLAGTKYPVVQRIQGVVKIWFLKAVVIQNLQGVKNSTNSKTWKKRNKNVWHQPVLTKREIKQVCKDKGVPPTYLLLSPDIYQTTTWTPQPGRAPLLAPRFLAALLEPAKWMQIKTCQRRTDIENISFCEKCWEWKAVIFSQMLHYSSFSCSPSIHCKLFFSAGFNHLFG